MARSTMPTPSVQEELASAATIMAKAEQRPLTFKTPTEEVLTALSDAIKEALMTTGGTAEGPHELDSLIFLLPATGLDLLPSEDDAIAAAVGDSEMMTVVDFAAAVRTSLHGPPGEDESMASWAWSHIDRGNAGKVWYNRRTGRLALSPPPSAIRFIMLHYHSTSEFCDNFSSTIDGRGAFDQLASDEVARTAACANLAAFMAAHPMYNEAEEAAAILKEGITEATLQLQAAQAAETSASAAAKAAVATAAADAESIIAYRDEGSNFRELFETEKCVFQVQDENARSEIDLITADIAKKIQLLETERKDLATEMAAREAAEVATNAELTALKELKRDVGILVAVKDARNLLEEERSHILWQCNEESRRLALARRQLALSEEKRCRLEVANVRANALTSEVKAKSEGTASILEFLAAGKKVLALHTAKLDATRSRRRYLEERAAERIRLSTALLNNRETTAYAQIIEEVSVNATKLRNLIEPPPVAKPVVMKPSPKPMLHLPAPVISPRKLGSSLSTMGRKVHSSSFLPQVINKT